MNRRRFLATASGALGSSVLSAAEPFHRAGQPRLMLGCAAYGFREYFEFGKDKPQKPREGHEPMDMLRFVDFCADQGCDGAELTSYYFPANVTDEYLIETRRRAFMRGIAISGTAVGNVWTHPKGSPERDKEIAYTKLWIDRAVTLGTSHVRVFAGQTPKGMSVEDAMANCIAAFQECAAYAGRRGVFLGMENHGGIVAEPDNLLKIMRAVNSPWIGINFDSGNYKTEDPYADLAKIAPYAVNVQFKGEIQRKGAPAPEPSDFKRVIQILKDSSYQGWFTL
ncbi:MAG TPA: sugar phosphate isomerase/epimerase family protein, partial [Verrucomicrobiaceae bacterium]